jgi:hypothetical protein
MNNLHTAAPADRPAPPPFKPGDRAIWRPHPDGVEEVVDADARDRGKFMRTKRRPRALVEATRYARTSDFQFART